MSNQPNLGLKIRLRTARCMPSAEEARTVLISVHGDLQEDSSLCAIWLGTELTLQPCAVHADSVDSLDQRDHRRFMQS